MAAAEGGDLVAGAVEDAPLSLDQRAPGGGQLKGHAGGEAANEVASLGIEFHVNLFGLELRWAEHGNVFELLVQDCSLGPVAFGFGRREDRHHSRIDCLGAEVEHIARVGADFVVAGIEGSFVSQQRAAAAAIDGVEHAAVNNLAAGVEQLNVDGAAEVRGFEFAGGYEVACKIDSVTSIVGVIVEVEINHFLGNQAGVARGRRMINGQRVNRVFLAERNERQQQSNKRNE